MVAVGVTRALKSNQIKNYFIKRSVVVFGLPSELNEQVQLLFV